jgi:hypothetical protein
MSSLAELLRAVPANIRASEGAGTTTLTRDDNRVQVFNLSAARTVVLPTTGIKAGDVIVLRNRSTFVLTVKSSDTTNLTIANGHNTEGTLRNGYISIMALQDTPTTNAHWITIDAIEQGSFAPTVSSTTNIDATSGSSGKFFRNLNKIDGVFVLNIDVTTINTQTIFSTDIPVARSSNFTTANGQAAGIGQRAVGSGTWNGFMAQANNGAQTLQWYGTASVGTSETHSLSYTYSLT